MDLVSLCHLLLYCLTGIFDFRERLKLGKKITKKGEKRDCHVLDETPLKSHITSSPYLAKSNYGNTDEPEGSRDSEFNHLN